LNDTVHLSSSPPNMQRGRRKKGSFFLKFLPATLSPGAHRPDTMADHPPRTCQKAGEGGRALAVAPNGRPAGCSPCSTAKSHSLGSINNNQHSSNEEKRRKQTGERRKQTGDERRKRKKKQRRERGRDRTKEREGREGNEKNREEEREERKDQPENKKKANRKNEEKGRNGENEPSRRKQPLRRLESLSVSYDTASTARNAASHRLRLRAR